MAVYCQNDRKIPKYRPTISACMIVKNEEAFLPNCLQSIQDYVDEIIVVDTGSEDETVSIARSFGATVYLHPWENNFSKHRNQSISYAKGDWILYIDADEELLSGSGEALLEAIEGAGEADAIAVLLECGFEQGSATATNNSIRIFRNNRRLKFKGRVHNYVAGAKKVLCAPIRLFHHGYNLDEEKRKKKFERTTALLKKDIEENFENPRPHHFLGVAYLSEQMFTEAAQEAEKAIALYESGEMEHHNFLWALYVASNAFFELGDLGKAERFAEKGINICSHYLDGYFLLAIIAYKKGCKEDFETWKGRYLETKHLFEENRALFGGMVLNTFESQWLLHLFSGLLETQLGDDPDKARAELATGQAQCPDPISYHHRLGAAFTDMDRYDEAESQFMKALDLRPDHKETIWKLSQLYEITNRMQKKILWLEKLLAHHSDFFDGWFNLGLTLLNMGHFEKALRCFRQARVLAPQDVRSRINSAICLRGMGKHRECIRLLEDMTSTSPEETLAVVSNLAFAYFAAGKFGQAAEMFKLFAEKVPESLAPPVYLAQIFWDMGRFEDCQAQCARLSSLLNMEEEKAANSVKSLGAAIVMAGERLALERGAKDLAMICLQLGEKAGCKSAETMAHVGEALVNANDPAGGVLFIEKALRVAPRNKKVLAIANDATRALENIVLEATNGCCPP